MRVVQIVGDWHVFLVEPVVASLVPANQQNRCAAGIEGVKYAQRFATCPFRKSYPDVLVVQSSQDRNGDNGARSLDCSMQVRIFL